MSDHAGHYGRRRQVVSQLLVGDFEDDSSDLLNLVIKDAVLPQLLKRHMVLASQTEQQREQPVHALHTGIGACEVDAMCRALIGQGPCAPADVLSRVRSSGMMCRAQLYDDLLGGAARRLGDGWLDDDLSFFDVTVGMSRLHELFHGEVERHRKPVPANVARRTVLLAGAPGEQHVFGLSIVEQAFTDAGWNVLMMAGNSWDEVCATLSGFHCDLLGVTWSVTGLQKELSSSIQRARQVSINRDIKVLVGGQQFVDSSSLACVVGADSSAGDAVSALEVAGRLVPGCVPIEAMTE
jgi:methanogenic corrinoid protein MtbC1